MREIIHLQVGQCGNAIGSSFWDTIYNEHGLNSNGVSHGESFQQERLAVYFNKASDHNYIPRAILVDLDPETIDSIRSSPIGRQFRPENFLSGEYSAGNNWAKGYYTEGGELIDQVLDAVRGEAERCDCLSGFQMTHSLGGGTGAGMGSLLLSRLREEFPDRMIATFSILPSASLSDCLVEPYNTVLSINQLIEHANMTFCIDNQALFNICKGTLGLSDPSYGDINPLIATVMSGVTTSFRFHGQLNSDLHKLVMNMAPFPRLHFSTMGFAPLPSASGQSSRDVTIPELAQQVFDPKNTVSGCDIRNGRFLACSAIFRGKVNMTEVEEHIRNIRRQSPTCFIDAIQGSLCRIPYPGLMLSSTFIGNSTAIQEPFKRIGDQFNFMFRRKRYLNPYSWQGMDEMEFTEAESNMSDLIADYQKYQDTGVYDECH